MTEQNNTARLEAFSDGVFAIALTLLVIEIKVPHLAHEASVSELWLSLKHLSPSFFAFLLSFVIILISWVNHHSILRLITKSSYPFIYANGFLLLTIVFMPFPTAFLAEYGLTDLASPAVALYSFMNLMQAIAWTVMMRSALYPHSLAKNSSAAQILRETCKKSFYAIFVYATCTVIAFWFPFAIAIVITLIWIVWLVVGLNFKEKSLVSS
jgi:uncharacterized membrane protein